MASSCGRPLRRGRNREELLHLARAADADTVATEIRVPLRYVLATVCITLVSIFWYAAWSAVGGGPAAVVYLAMPLAAAVSFRDTTTLPAIPVPAVACVAAGFLVAMWAMGRAPLGVTSRDTTWPGR
jgi:hypothetical protein